MPIFITVFCENCYKLTKCQTIKIFQFGGRKEIDKAGKIEFEFEFELNKHEFAIKWVDFSKWIWKSI